MIEIPLSGNYVALVDDEDGQLARFKWSASVYHRKDGTKRVYAVRQDPVTKKQLTMHIEIMGSHGEIDHRNGNGLDNLRDNLRPCTRSQNNANSLKRSGKSSKYKGVHFHRQCRKWNLQINKKHLGLFVEEVDAATAYNFHAQELYGEFVRYNLPC